MKITYLILLFTLLVACLPESQVRAPIADAEQNSSTGSDSSGDSTSDDETSLFGFNTNWFNSGLTSEILTVNFDNSKTIYLLGDQIHNYLSVSDNYAANYCLEVRFGATNTTTPKILRVKVAPAFSNNFHVGVTTKFLRVNLNTDSGNSFCNVASKEIVAGQLVTIAAGDTNYDGIVNGNDNSYVYQTEDVCTNCQNILASNQVILYKYNEGGSAVLTSDDYLERLDPTIISYEDLILRIDMNSNSSGGGSSCSDSACQTNGFDCCVDGQCVNEKSVKIAGVYADPNGFAVAEQEKYSDANWFKKYPQFYYICLEQVPGDGGSTGGGGTTDPEDPIGDAGARLEALIKDYQCVEDLKASSEQSPFHKDAINNTNTCNFASDTYENVFKRLYKNCGCAEQTNLSTMVNTCPAYTYTPVYQTDSYGNQTTTILSISCVTPPVEQTPPPFQNLNVIVNSRVAPHRFFDTAGKEITPGKDLPTGATGNQEGIKFEYLDNYYIFPKNYSFNMNSILGEFNISLSKAQPAVAIDVEFDKQYLISTLNGFYASCPTCAKDSWFSNFSPTPTANYGVGLQGVYFTTRRDTYGSNTTLGNYEDTLFGRACFVPPTMIPYSHQSIADSQTQRMTRLKTQAALFANGYQRDWYGFNRGALIGSFDGVTWFAVGKGRIVKANSNKLFLAINAPFADLATPTNHTVAVQEYDFTASAPRFDYVPGLEINDAFQNEAGSCQKFHECETDAHCISKLGWEYVCADVTYTQTKWPSFEPTGATETASSSLTGTIAEFLQQGQLPPDSTTKRCVYRGAGAPCRTDYENISDEGKRKTLTCAPNFYCADLDESGVFNDEVARFGRPLDELIESNNHLYGQEANILGRPKSYVASSTLSSLPTEVKNAIESNVLLTDATASGKVGLCRPGKLLPEYSNSTTTNYWEQNEQHMASDSLHRTDYISQIGACNSALYTPLRYSSCPMLDDDGNYIHTQDQFLDGNFFVEELNAYKTQQWTTQWYSFAQNACGLESLRSDATYGVGISADQLKNYSAFKTIEGFSLANSPTIVEKTLARDACLRKAGSVCHTDLDCSPNRLMASVVDLVNPSYFGNAAEKLYYEEYLVCGQAESEPMTASATNFNTYSMHNNRCCRPIGQELTMFTENSPSESDSTGLRSDLFGSLNPTNTKRYSRYSAINSTIDASTNEAQITRPSADTTDANFDHLLDNEVNITNSYQWKTLHNSAAKICCGGSWVRKFADGTNDWNQNRLNLDVSDFKCLNYNSPLPLTDDPNSYGLTSAMIDSGINNFCADPTLASGGCIEKGHGEMNDFSEVKPHINETNVEQLLFTDPAEWSNTDNFSDGKISSWDQYPWAFHTLIPLNGSADDLVMDWTVGSASDANRNVIRAQLPPYIAYNNFNTEVKVYMKHPSGTGNAFEYDLCSRLYPGDLSCPAGNYGLCEDLVIEPTHYPWSTNNVCGDIDSCCFTYDESSRKISIAFSNAITMNAGSYNNSGNILGAKIAFTAPGTLLWEKNKISTGTTVGNSSVLAHRRSSTPGNSLYYLKKLARFEYVGIPQMTYEPIYCNDNYQKMVPGLFQDVAFSQQLQTVIDFLSHTKTFIDSGVGTPWETDNSSGNVSASYRADILNKNYATTQELVDHAPIFSDNKFKCCLELGSETTSKDMCCSGYAVDSSGSASGSPLYCKLPAGTDLNVYFNKFVSGEGISDKYSETTLDIFDFDPRTGEPLLSTSILQKLNALGKEFCASGVTRRGGAYGNFPAKPTGPLQTMYGVDGETNYSIVDSIFDEGSINNVGVGYSWFAAGYRWNHHVYCAPGSN